MEILKLINGVVGVDQFRCHDRSGHCKQINMKINLIYAIFKAMLIFFQTFWRVDSVKLRSWLGSNQFVEGNSPEGRESGQIMTVIRDKLYIFLGTKGAGYLNDLHTFHFISRTWIDITQSVQGPPPSPRYGHSCASVGDRFYVFGGRSSTGGFAISCKVSHGI